MKPGGPGWNDPPQLSHQIHSETKTRRNLLNKRVSYLDGSKTKVSPSEPLSPHVPPPAGMARETNAVPPTEVKTIPSNIFVPNVNENKISDDFQESVNDTGTTKREVERIEFDEDMDIYSRLLMLTDTFKSGKNTAITSDIDKKLKVLKSMVDDKSLSSSVLAEMKSLTTYLLNKQYQKAWDIHVSLMCDHVSEVRQWMVGVKRLINELRNFDSA